MSRKNTLNLYYRGSISENRWFIHVYSMSIFSISATKPGALRPGECPWEYQWGVSLGMWQFINGNINVELINWDLAIEHGPFIVDLY